MRVIRSPSRLLGTLTFWAIFLGALSIAVDVLGIAALEDLVHAVWAYIPNILAAILIFVVAGLIATAIVELVDRTMGDTPTGGIVKAVAPVLVMAIAVFMILDQLEIAPTIVTITYAALVGAVALGIALAFGLGGRDVAGRILESAYVKGQEATEDVKRDLRTGADRANGTPHRPPSDSTSHLQSDLEGWGGRRAWRSPQPEGRRPELPAEPGVPLSGRCDGGFSGRSGRAARTWLETVRSTTAIGGRSR